MDNKVKCFRYLFERLEEVINSNLRIHYDLEKGTGSIFRGCFLRGANFRKELEQFEEKCTKNRLLIQRDVHKPLSLTLNCIINSPDLVKIIDQYDYFVVTKDTERIISIHNPGSPSSYTAFLELDHVYQDLLKNIDKSKIESFYRPRFNRLNHLNYHFLDFQENKYHFFIQPDR